MIRVATKTFFQDHLILNIEKEAEACHHSNCIPEWSKALVISMSHTRKKHVSRVKIYCLHLEAEVKVMCMIKCQKEKLKKKQELCNQQHSVHNGDYSGGENSWWFYTSCRRKSMGNGREISLFHWINYSYKNPQNFKRVCTFKLSKLSIHNKGNTDLTKKENSKRWVL